MDCIRVGIVFEAFYQRYVVPKKDKAPRWASQLESFRNKAALTPEELLLLLDTAWAWGSRFYDTNHGEGACYELLHLLFSEARVVYLREKGVMPEDLALRLARRLYFDVSRDPKLRKTEAEAKESKILGGVEQDPLTGKITVKPR